MEYICLMCLAISLKIQAIQFTEYCFNINTEIHSTGGWYAPYTICMRMKINRWFEQFTFHNEPRRNEDDRNEGEKYNNVNIATVLGSENNQQPTYTISDICIAKHTTLNIKCRSYLFKSKLHKDINEKSDGDDDKKRLPTLACTIFSY